MSAPGSSSGVPRWTGAGRPEGDVLSRHDTQADAQHVVDVLARSGFPIRRVAIVGSELISVESVTAARSYGRSALAGSLVGGWLGLMAGLVLLVVAPLAGSVPLFAATVLIGAGFGMLFRLVTHAVTRKGRAYLSVTSIAASSYEVIVPFEGAARARNILAEHSDDGPVTRD